MHTAPDRVVSALGCRPKRFTHLVEVSLQDSVFLAQIRQLLGEAADFLNHRDVAGNTVLSRPVGHRARGNLTGNGVFDATQVKRARYEWDERVEDSFVGKRHIFSSTGFCEISVRLQKLVLQLSSPSLLSSTRFSYSPTWCARTAKSARRRTRSRTPLGAF